MSKFPNTPMARTLGLHRGFVETGIGATASAHMSLGKFDYPSADFGVGSANPLGIPEL